MSNYKDAMVDAAARAMAEANGLQWDEPCGYDTHGDFCDNALCMGAHDEDHDPQLMREHYMAMAKAAVAAALTAGLQVRSKMSVWQKILGVFK